MGVEVFRLVSLGGGRRHGARVGSRSALRVASGVGVVVSDARRERGGRRGAERACSAGKGEAQLFEGDDDVVDPRPGLLEPHDGLAAGVSNVGGGVPDAVTEPFGFGDGESTVEASMQGRLRSPVSLAARMRFSTWAR